MIHARGPDLYCLSGLSGGVFKDRCMGEAQEAS